MVPRGLIGYLAGMILLTGGTGLALLTMLYAVLLPRGRAMQVEGGILLIISAVLVFGAVHLVSGGLYRMLVHVYHTVSRTDPAGDRRLRGRTLYLLGQFSTTMTVPITFLFAALALSEAGRPEQEMGLVLVGVLPAGFTVVLSLLAWSGGLAIMVRDLFIRHRDIVEKREMERRRRLAEANESQTEEVSSEHLTPEELRQHIKENR
jgi:hypothetical protein